MRSFEIQTVEPLFYNETQISITSDRVNGVRDNR